MLNPLIKKFLKRAKGISEDTRSVKKGELFFVREREGFDIFSVLPSIDDTVLAFVVDVKAKSKMPSLAKPVIYIDDLQAVYRAAIDAYYGFNPKNFKFIGVTGTNGKTTTVFLIHHILNKLGKKSALLGTVKYMIGNKDYPSTHTTPDYLSLRKLFKVCREKKAKYIVMEASSHGIAQGRVAGIKFSACVFTNLTRDHLDYHKTFDNYFAAKQKLFFDNPNAVAVINADDEHGRMLLKKCHRVISFGEHGKPDLLADNIKLDMSGTSFDVVYENKRTPFKTHLMGRHNVYNILSAIGPLLGMGFKLKDILRALKSFKYVPGRLEEVAKDIFVDYAHTPDGLIQVLKTLRECQYKHITCLFGCGGDRDKGKRPMMGKISCEMADFSIVTSDNPRTEDPAAIIDDIKRGFTNNNFICIAERKTAVGRALAEKRRHQHSCLLLAGKGHEDYQVVGTVKLPYSDQQALKKALKHAH